MRQPCEGEGIQVDDTRYRNTICPICKGIAAVDIDDRIEPHTVLVIDCGGDDEIVAD